MRAVKPQSDFSSYAKSDKVIKIFSKKKKDATVSSAWQVIPSRSLDIFSLLEATKQQESHNLNVTGR